MSDLIGKTVPRMGPPQWGPLQWRRGIRLSAGVYELPAGARVYQAIESAGGTLDGAAPRAFMGGTGVFMVEGLQLIVAVLLMILGVTIVFTSGKELIRGGEPMSLETV